MNSDDNFIYALLREHLPAAYPPLEKISKELEHPGDLPKSPVKTETISFCVDANTDFASIAEHLQSIILKGSRKTSFSLERKVIGTEIMHDKWSDEQYEALIYGDVISIKFSATVETPNLSEKIREHEAAVKNWKARIEARRERKALIEKQKRQNNELIHAARKKDIALWRLAGKSINGKLKPDFKAAIRNKLLEQIAALDASESSKIL